MQKNELSSNIIKSVAPKFKIKKQWSGYTQRPWLKKDKKKVTILFSFVERRKSYFLRAYFKRNGFKYIDMGDHIKEDVRYGREYGSRAECNPMYFTSGSLIRHLLKIEKESGLSREEIAEKYIFLGGGGQCGPCRYGMYPAEYLKVTNDAGFKNFRILIFSSDIEEDVNTSNPKEKLAFNFHMPFRVNLAIAFILADLIHAADCAIRPYTDDKEHLDDILTKIEKMLLKAFSGRLYLFTLPRVLKKAAKMLAAIPKKDIKIPLIYVTGEFFANLAHNDGNYHLRKFISNEGCEVMPGSFTQRALYDNWRRTIEANRGIKYAKDEKEVKFYTKSLKKQKASTFVIKYFYNKYAKALNPEAFGGRTDLLDLDEMATLAKKLYNPEIFGGEGHLEVAEAIHLAKEVDGFISSKPFGCMPSSGVSDGVQAKVMSMYPELNFLSIETSGDNDINILSRVSMLLLKAKEIHAGRMKSLEESKKATEETSIINEVEIKTAAKEKTVTSTA
jgi:predicted nucleotide-binding protein (sugar kinase/HSP70/actin superfamily)